MRVLLKLSGEILTGKEKFGISSEALKELTSSIKKSAAKGLEIGIVIGGGNIFRGSALKQLEIEQVPCDHIGMLATMMNGIAIKNSLEQTGIKAHVLSALDCPKVVESYQWEKAIDLLNKKEIVIFAGGTGNPYFTTDTAAALRASEIKADYLLKATKVDGVYSEDPLKNSKAIKYNTLSYSQVLAEKLEFMDATSIALCMKNRIPIFVFNMALLGKYPLDSILSQHSLGTLIHEK